MIMDRPHLMAAAIRAAALSPDPSTQNGAILATPAGQPMWPTAVCNEFPKGVKYRQDRWERPLKYSYIEHAERHAIYAAARNGIATEGLILVCPWAACAECARAIAVAGIAELVTLAPDPDATNERWDASITIAFEILAESSVKITFLDGPLPQVPVLRRNGSDWWPS